ncbi:MAG: YdjY domain-containing protein [Planctomycetota bacterium]
MIAPALVIATAMLLTQPEGRIDAFPGIVVDYDARSIELAGFVPVDAHSEETPDVIVEVVAEAGGVRDHEALVRIEAEARHVHAALLLLGLEPGTPGAILNDGTRREPEGPELIVTVRYEADGATVEESPIEWVHDPDAGTRLIDTSPGFRFTGSSEREFDGATYYMAEAEGVVVGLSTFGAGDAENAIGIETVGMTPVYNPDISSGDPIWLADADRVPTFETRVTLVLSVPG